MEHKNIGTIDGKPITQEMLADLSATFERDWNPFEITVVPTERGKVLRALHDLNLPLYEIEALERRAKQKNQSLSFYVHNVLQNDLFIINDDYG